MKGREGKEIAGLYISHITMLSQYPDPYLVQVPNIQNLRTAAGSVWEIPYSYLKNFVTYQTQTVDGMWWKLVLATFTSLRIHGSVQFGP